MNDTFGQRLRILREDKKLGQIALAKELGVGKSIISSWERDESEPTLSKIRNIALFFGVTADYLCGLSDI